MAEMDQMIEMAGENVEAAIAAGLARLGVERDAVEIEVLDEGRQGMFGLGARAARVRLTVTTPPPPATLVEPPPPSPVEPVAPIEPPPSPPVEPEPSHPPPAEATAPEMVEEKIEVAQSVMQDLLTLMGMDKARVDVHLAEPGPNDTKVPPLVLDVRGPGTDVLIGRGGETLDALQSITRLIVGREMKGWVHLVVDVQGYKTDRAESLKRLARRMADQAVRTNRTVNLEPMPPHERRVVHMALYDDPRVTTESIYEGDRRRVTIIPR
jgi:spoIIIJ-associated protein